jgi:tRNA nucleotidyltransferase/poly(A) polymerase
MPAEIFSQIASANGFTVQAIYRNTGTVKITDGEVDYEYSSFRSDKYVRGTHVPVEIFFTEDISLDARRRDFTANAVYYDIAKEEFVDPLDGISAVKARRLTTVDNAKKVFGADS